VNRELARKVADAVLYEGYMLYPYRPSAIKNRQRWTFGILYPPAYAEVGSGTERCKMHSELLLETSGDATMLIQLRFLHSVARQVARSLDGNMEPGRFESVSSMVVNDRLIPSWDEGVERSVEFELASLSTPQQHQFHFHGSSETEWLRDNTDRIVGKIARTQHEVTGTVSVSPEQICDGVLKLTIDVTNNTASLGLDPLDRNSALLRSLLSAHTILTANRGQFISLLDPPGHLRNAATTCKNVGNFPVLVGEQPERQMLLCSPIVLYDYPQVAPESANDFFDATEMDEMLTLRVVTLTDGEKDEMRLADDHVRDLLQRTEQNAREQLTKTHGTIRGLRPISENP
jgi:hypothetical protein